MLGPEETQEDSIESKAKKICPNCEKKISQKAKFCPKCGQKQDAVKPKLRDLLWSLWMRTFHLDNRVLRSFGLVLLPPKLTLAFFAGKRKRYLHPIQFLFIALFFLTLTVSIFNKKDRSFSLFDFFADKSPEYLKGQIDLRDSLDRQYLNFPEKWQNPTSDSLLQLATRLSTSRRDSIHIGLLTNKNKQPYVIARKDMIALDPDTLLQRYQVEGRTNRFLIRQMLRAGTHGKELGHFWVGSLSTSYLVLIVVMALWLKLLYWRQKRYFVEHLVLMLNLQTGVLVAFTFSLLLRHLLWFPKSWTVTLFVLWCTIAYFWAFKSFYGQSKMKTTFKYLLFGLLFFVSFLIVFVGSLGAAVLLF